MSKVIQRCYGTIKSSGSHIIEGSNNIINGNNNKVKGSNNISNGTGNNSKGSNNIDNSDYRVLNLLVVGKVIEVIQLVVMIAVMTIKCALSTLVVLEIIRTMEDQP